jgi:hypothetical protein
MTIRKTRTGSSTAAIISTTRGKAFPIIFFFDGEHEDYHGAGDTADKIDYEKMEKITRTFI